jgi:hypothetical protein
MTITNLVKESEQRYLNELKTKMYGGLKGNAELLRERDPLIENIEQISPLEQAVEKHQELKNTNQKHIDLVKYVEKRKKKVPKLTLEQYGESKKIIGNFEKLDELLYEIEKELPIEGIISVDDSLKLLLPVYKDDKIPKTTTLGHELYSQVSKWFNTNIAGLNDSNITLPDITVSEFQDLLVITAKPNKETEKARKGLNVLKEKLFENLNQLDLSRLNKANIKFSLYYDEEGYLFGREGQEKRFYTPKEIYEKFGINSAKLAWLTKRGLVTPKNKGGERYYDVDAIDKTLQKPLEIYTRREAAQRWKELEQRITGKDIPLGKYLDRIYIIKEKLVPRVSQGNPGLSKEEFDNYLVRMSLLYQIKKHKRKFKKAIQKNDLKKLLKVDEVTLDKFVGNGLIRVDSEGAYIAKSVSNFIRKRMYTGKDWVSYK